MVFLYTEMEERLGEEGRCEMSYTQVLETGGTACYTEPHGKDTTW